MYSLVKRINLGLSEYKENEQGAVTVEFVALTGVVVLIGIAATTGLGDKVTAAITTLSL